MNKEIQSSAQEQNFFEYMKNVNDFYVRSKSDQYSYDFLTDKPITSLSLSNIDDLVPDRKYRLSLTSSGKKKKRGFRKMSETSTRERSPRKKLSFDNI